MSFYSSLCLVANRGVKKPTIQSVMAIFEDLRIVDVNSYQLPPPVDIFSSNVRALFVDELALAKNERFFCPDMISLNNTVQIMSCDENYEGSGWSINISGNGYFFPWELTDYRDRVIRSALFVTLREEVNKQFGGHFRYPKRHEEYLRSRCIDGADGWVWFGSGT